MRRSVVIALILGSALWAALPAPAGAVPAFARRYGVSCSACHTSWPALNSTGMAFKLSGYRRLNGQDLKPTTPDIELGEGLLTIPSIPPFSLVGTAGWDTQWIDHRSFDASRAHQVGSSLDLNQANVFVASPLGDHLSTFFEFPFFETHAPGNDFPTGPSGANATQIPTSTGGGPNNRDIVFETESPTFELGKVMWNSLLPLGIAPPDVLNLKLGVDQLPTGFSSEANRLTVRGYMIYRRRALDLLSPVQTDDLLGDSADGLIRLGEPQIQVALNGIVVPFGPITDLGKPEVLSFDYEIGLTNGSNVGSDPNTEKDFFAHVGINFLGQRLGFFGYASPDIYDDNLRDNASIAFGGIMSGKQRANRMHSYGPDLTLSLEPLNIPVWSETQVLFNRESNPTGFDKSFSWWGGFSQLNARIPIRAKYLQWITAYGRYEWIRGDKFDDTGNGGVIGPAAAGGATGGAVRPREWQVVFGAQAFILENLKVIAEWSRHQFDNPESGGPTTSRLKDSFFTVRAAFGF
jgi:hypothetical protein